MTGKLSSLKNSSKQAKKSFYLKKWQRFSHLKYIFLIKHDWETIFAKKKLIQTGKKIIFYYYKSNTFSSNDAKVYDRAPFSKFEADLKVEIVILHLEDLPVTPGRVQPLPLDGLNELWEDLLKAVDNNLQIRAGHLRYFWGFFLYRAYT